MSTFLELQAEVLSDDLDATKYRARVKTWLNEAVGLIVRRVDVLQQAASSTVTLAAGTTSYALPSDLVRLRSVVNTDRYPLREVDALTIDTASLSTGDPAVYSVNDNTLEVYPTPAAGDTLTLRYWARPALMTGDSATTGIPTDYEHLLVTYARGRAWRAEDDLEMARAHMKEFDDGVLAMRSDVQRPSRNRRLRLRSSMPDTGLTPFVKP